MKTQHVCTLSAIIWCCIVNGQPVESNAVDDDEPRDMDDDSSSSFSADLAYGFRIYSECVREDLSSCLKLKLVAAMDRAARSYYLEGVRVLDGVAFVHDPAASDAETSGPLLDEGELEATLPRSLEDKEDTLNGLIIERVVGFFRTHSLQLEESQRSLSDEARRRKKKKKNKKLGSLLLIPLLMAGTLVPLAFGALALLAGKALLVSKVALILSTIIGLKKLFGQKSADHESTVVVGDHHGRSFEEPLQNGDDQNFKESVLFDPHLLAYSDYVHQRAAAYKVVHPRRALKEPTEGRPWSHSSDQPRNKVSVPTDHGRPGECVTHANSPACFSKALLMVVVELPTADGSIKVECVPPFQQTGGIT
uniref:Uncharacterized protein n=1 Tax=Timema douglasi TaxID=61478 RepID=A0A7R8ZGD8_TIMDO|nr:unnamed protein product [Timema douglasi]